MKNLIRERDMRLLHLNIRLPEASWSAGRSIRNDTQEMQKVQI